MPSQRPEAPTPDRLKDFVHIVQPENIGFFGEEAKVEGGGINNGRKGGSGRGGGRETG